MFIPIVIPVNPPCDSHKVSLTHVSPMLNGLTHGIPREIPRFSTSQEDYSVCFLPNDHSVLPRGRLSAADRALARSSPNADEVPRGSQGRKLMAFNGDKYGNMGIHRNNSSNQPKIGSKLINGDIMGIYSTLSCYNGDDKTIYNILSYYL